MPNRAFEPQRGAGPSTSAAAGPSFAAAGQSVTVRGATGMRLASKGQSAEASRAEEQHGRLERRAAVPPRGEGGGH